MPERTTIEIMNPGSATHNRNKNENVHERQVEIHESETDEDSSSHSTITPGTNFSLGTGTIANFRPLENGDAALHNANGIANEQIVPLTNDSGLGSSLSSQDPNGVNYSTTTNSQRSLESANSSPTENRTSPSFPMTQAPGTSTSQQINDTHQNLVSEPSGATTNQAPNYCFERDRLQSYPENWQCPVQPQELAANGFYWSGETDVVRCAFCRLEVRGWETGDTARGEHNRWNASCPFTNGRPVGNVPIGQENQQRNEVNFDVCGTAVLEQRPFSFPENFHLRNGVKKGSPEEFGITELPPPVHQKYAALEARMTSYQGLWPVSMKQTPVSLSAAGFYYTGKGDRVICFQCGGGLKDWHIEDEPWEEHARWFSKCPYLILYRGADFVKSVAAQDKKPILSAGEVANCDSEKSAISEKTTNPSDKDMDCDEVASKASDKDAENAKKDESRLCKVCYENELAVVFLPCGHICACMDCAPQLSKCPVCRKVSTAYIRAYLP